MRFLILLVLSSVMVTSARAADVTQVNPTELGQQGMTAYQRGDYASAARYLSARARMAPQDPKVFYYLGNCYIHAKQNEHAARMYSACIRSGPNSEASKLALSALETLSTMPKRSPEPEQKNANPEDTRAAAEASRDALTSTTAVDKAYNDAVTRIRSQRQTFKIKVDQIWHRLEDDLTAMHPKTTPNYAIELERVRRESDNKVEYEQLKQLRWESRMIAPDKVDVRAVPDTPKEKADDTKTALGSLSELVKQDKPFDPFGTEINAEIAAKFLTIKDVFGELNTYQPAERRVAKQCFAQLKNSIEIKQDSLDQQISQIKDTLVRDLMHIKINYNVAGDPYYLKKESNPLYHMASSKIPRADESHKTPVDIEIQQTTDRAKKRISELKETYLKNVDALIAAAKERVGGMVVQNGQMNSQLKKPNGTIQIVPQGSDTYTRNYVNFGSSEIPSASRPSPVPLRAEAKKITPPARVTGSPPVKKDAE
ncbi:MAG: tetratricopeptide repeat protein [Candidatus Obscuribacterales bacterium]|nr:tetratricopeptide repeat protein [Candidatus Obscuribacterales bacterium]